MNKVNITDKLKLIDKYWETDQVTARFKDNFAAIDDLNRALETEQISFVEYLRIIVDKITNDSN